MYPGYSYDRKKLKYKFENKNNSVNQLKNLIIKIKKTLTCVIVYLFSKGTLVGILLLLNQPTTSIVKLTPPQVCINKFNNNDLQLSNYSHSIRNFVLDTRGGSTDVEKQDEQKLLTSILAKTQQSSLSEISFNKYLRKILFLVDPFISNKDLWTIVNEFYKPIPPNFTKYEIKPSVVPNSSRSADKSSSFLFAEAFNVRPMNSHSNIQKRFELKMNDDKNSRFSELNKQDQQLLKSKEKLTKERRASPLYPSNSLGPKYKYSLAQLQKKVLRHSKDFGISHTDKTLKQISLEYKTVLEKVLAKKNLIVHKEALFTKNESTHIFGDPESHIVITFENNPNYQDHYFISGYNIRPEKFELFKETGHLGTSKKEKNEGSIIAQNNKVQLAKKKLNDKLFYSKLPSNARISNKQLRQVEELHQQLKYDQNTPLTNKQKELMRRAEIFKNYKDQSNNDIF